MASHKGRVDDAPGLDVFVGILQSLMKGSTVVVIEPVAGIERQELNLGSFGEIGRLVNDKSPRFHASPERHAITVSS